MTQAFQISLLVYAILISVGGVIGFLKGKSKASLIAGLTSGALLIGSYSISLRNPGNGFLFGTVIAVLLVIMFSARLAKTKKFMPSGMLLILSLIEGIILIVAMNTPV